MYDLLLKGGRILDPSTGLNGTQDIAIEQGKVAGIEAQIALESARRVVEIPGTIVTPGLIDLHAHVFEGFTRLGVHPDQGGVYAGVTTIVDAGSAGCATFGGFPRYIIPQCHTEIIPFLHICQTGLSTIPGYYRRGQYRFGCDSTRRRSLQGFDLWDQGTDGFAGPRNLRDGNAATGETRGTREWHQADGTRRRYRKTVRSDGYPPVAPYARKWRYPHPLFHG
jgi:hypothetical protein